MNKVQAIRHGDVALVCNVVLPKGLKPAGTNVIMKGNSGNDHAVKQNGIIYFQPEGQYQLGFLVASKRCQLVHPDHGDETGKTRISDIPTGTYTLLRQVEHTNQGMRPVID